VFFGNEDNAKVLAEFLRKAEAVHIGEKRGHVYFTIRFMV